jgi:hypothetical protein
MAAHVARPIVGVMTIPTKKTRLFARADVRRDEFVEKLSERWVVEQGVAELYRLAYDRLRGVGPLAGVLPDLQRFALQERRHAQLLEQLSSEMGRDPLAAAETPSFTIGAGDMATLVELMRRPELTARHTLEVLLLAERLDGAGWELLIELAKEAELDEEYLRSFRMAGREEEEHVHIVREHLLRTERAELFAGAPSR